MKQEIKELKGIRKELEQLRFENKVLKQLQEQEHRQSLNGKTEEPSLSEMIAYLKHKNILLVGGHVNFQNKLTELLPNIKMFDVSENNGKILKNLNTCDAIFLYTDYLNHGLYYRVMSEISNKDKIFYLDSHVNMSLTIKRIYDLLYVYKH